MDGGEAGFQHPCCTSLTAQCQAGLPGLKRILCTLGGSQKTTPQGASGRHSRLEKPLFRRHSPEHPLSRDHGKLEKAPRVMRSKGPQVAMDTRWWTTDACPVTLSTGRLRSTSSSTYIEDLSWEGKVGKLAPRRIIKGSCAGNHTQPLPAVSPNPQRQHRGQVSAPDTKGGEKWAHRVCQA